MRALTWTVALGTTLALLGSTDNLSAQTATIEETHKAEPTRGIEDLRRAIRSPQVVRERFEAIRKAQKQIEAARKDDQSIALARREEAIQKEATPTKKQVHRIAIQVDQNDPAVMNLALNNAENLTEYYKGRGEDVQIEIVAFGPGLHMLREDSSPVKDRIKRLKEGALPRLTFSACGNTQARMEKSEGKPITTLPQATMVPSGVVRLMELQEQGWSYVRP